MYEAHPDIFLTLPQTLLLPRSILSRPHAVPAQHHSSKTVNIPAVHMLTRITVNRQKKSAPIELSEGKNQAGKKQWGHEEEEECTGKGWPQFCVFWVLPQLYLVQQNTSHIKGSYLDRQGRLSRGKRSLTAQKHCCITSSCTVFVVSELRLGAVLHIFTLCLKASVQIPKLYFSLIF